MKVTRRTTREADAADDGLLPGALEELFARHQDELLGTLFYLVGNAEDARDALQETFVKCWRRREGLAEIENLKAWIFRVALNTGRDLRMTAWRRRRKPFIGETSMSSLESANPATHLEDEEQLASLRRAVRNLRAEEQEVFLLRQNGQMTYEDIAMAVGIPLSTAKTRMRLALTKLRIALH